jgi:DNA-binding GntR family transcriptional regulator
LNRAARPARVSLADTAYDAIRNLIVTLQVHPGQRLNEQILSEMTGIGRMPVRQAVQMLDAQGFLKVLPRKGILVPPDSLEDALTVLEARRVIEVEMARFAAQRANPAAIAAMEQILLAGQQALESEDFAAFMQQDRAFHERLTVAAGNPILYEMLNALHGRIARIWYLRSWRIENLRATQEAHTALLRAMAARDADGAADAMRGHIDGLRHILVDRSIPLA